VRITDGNADIVLATREGQSIRFEESQVRDTGRATQGVNGIRLKSDDIVVSLAVIGDESKDSAELLAVSERGFGKRTPLGEYPLQGRGGQGVITLKVVPKTGHLVGLSCVLGEEELFVLSERGVLIRTQVHQVSSYGRSSQGVTIMRMDAGDRVVSAMVMLAEEELEKVAEEKEAVVKEAVMKDAVQKEAVEPTAPDNDD
jgi:DNA gyrase subunit A